VEAAEARGHEIQIVNTLRVYMNIVSHRPEIRYQGETLFLTCPNCEGFITAEEFPRGTLAVWDFEPAGIADRDPAEILVAGAITEKNQFRMMLAGICPDCSGTIDT
jgi:hypothetical protein